jgi:hypothetical protein
VDEGLRMAVGPPVVSQQGRYARPTTVAMGFGTRRAGTRQQGVADAGCAGMGPRTGASEPVRRTMESA